MKWKKFKELSPAEQNSLMLAFLMLPVTGLGIRFLGLKKTQSVLRRTSFPKKQDALASPETTARMVRLASTHGFYHATCLPQSLTLWWLLRRRGLPGDLKIGVQNDNGQIKGHAWVECNGAILDEQHDIDVRYEPFSSEESKR